MQLDLNADVEHDLYFCSVPFQSAENWRGQATFSHFVHSYHWFSKMDKVTVAKKINILIGLNTDWGPVNLSCCTKLVSPWGECSYIHNYFCISTKCDDIAIFTPTISDKFVYKLHINGLAIQAIINNWNVTIWNILCVFRNCWI